MSSSVWAPGAVQHDVVWFNEWGHDDLWSDTQPERKKKKGMFIAMIQLEQMCDLM